MFVTEHEFEKNKNKTKTLGIGIVIITIVFLFKLLFALEFEGDESSRRPGGMQVCVRVEIIYIR